MSHRLSRVMAIALVIGLLAALVPMVALAQTTTKAPGTWVRSINIQNPTDAGGEAANVSINFYTADGTLALNFPLSSAIADGGSRSIFVPSEVPNLADGQYSAVIQSNVPLLVVANSSSTAPSTAGAYNGIDAAEAGTLLYFPGTYNDYYGFRSELVLQNTAATTANVTIRFYSNTGASAGSTNGTIPGNGSRVYALEDLALPTGTAGIFSVQVESNTPLVGVCNIWSPTMYGEYSDYNAYTTGTTMAYAPSLLNEYYGYVSALTVQNIDTADATIKVTYSNGTVETKTLAPRTSVEYYQPNNPNLPKGNTAGIFSAKVESTNGRNIVVLVNQEDKSKGLLASYNAPIQAATTVNAPVVLKTFYGWFSAVTVQNVGTGPANITVAYSSGQSRSASNVPANGTYNFIQMASDGDPLPDGSSVSAKISANQPLVVTVNENSDDRYAEAPGDYLLAYTAVPAP